MKIILGINANHADSSACILINEFNCSNRRREDK